LSHAVSQNLLLQSGLKAALHGQTVHIKAGMNVVIEAGASITLKAGTSFLTIGPALIVASSMPLPMPQASLAADAAVLAATIVPPPPAPVAPQDADPGNQ
jgi:type VI secretion system secreted protein VgrG